MYCFLPPNVLANKGSLTRKTPTAELPHGSNLGFFGHLHRHIILFFFFLIFMIRRRVESSKRNTKTRNITKLLGLPSNNGITILIGTLVSIYKHGLSDTYFWHLSWYAIHWIRKLSPFIINSKLFLILFIILMRFISKKVWVVIFLSFITPQ